MYGTANGRFYDAITMFKYAFEFYDTINVAEFVAQNEEFTVDVENTITQSKLELYSVPEEESYITDTGSIISKIKANPDRFTHEVTYTRQLTAPIAKDEQVGIVNYYFDGASEPILTCKLLAASAVEAAPAATPIPTVGPTPIPATPEPKSGLVQIVSDYWIYIAGGGAVIVILIIAIIAVSGGKRKSAGRRSAAPSRGRRTDTRHTGNSSRGRGRRR
jgi:hypothetical protein